MNSRLGVTATADMPVLLSELYAATSRKPGVLGCLTRRRTVQVRLGLEFGFGISDLGSLTTTDDVEHNTSDFAICSLVLKSFLANFQSTIHIRHSAIVDPVAPPPSRSRDCNS